jgi:hypothetical protein
MATFAVSLFDTSELATARLICAHAERILDLNEVSDHKVWDVLALWFRKHALALDEPRAYLTLTKGFELLT